MFICFSDGIAETIKQKEGNLTFFFLNAAAFFQLRAAGVSHQICVRESVGRSAGMAARRQDNVAADWEKNQRTNKRVQYKKNRQICRRIDGIR